MSADFFLVYVNYDGPISIVMTVKKVKKHDGDGDTHLYSDVRPPN